MPLGPDSTFQWAKDVAAFLGGLLMLAIVGVLVVGSLGWELARAVLAQRSTARHRSERPRNDR